MARFLIFCLLFLVRSFVFAQYDTLPKMEYHMYGRVGVHSSLSGKNVGARLNLSSMAGIGGRLEENDYMELTPIANLNSFLGLQNAPLMRVQVTVQAFSGNNTYISNQTTLNFIEAFLEVKDTLKGKPIELWVGSKFNRSRTINMIDYWDFDNLTGQGFGIKWGNTALSMVETIPFSDQPGNPYGNSDFNSTRQRNIIALKQLIPLGKKQDLFLLGELHFSRVDSLDPALFDDLNISDVGYVLGVQHHVKTDKHENYFTVRYGGRTANGPGDDNWSSRTFITFGVANNKGQYKGAYGLNFTESYLYSGNDKFNLEAYAVYRYARGASDPVFIDTSRPNEKWDAGAGVRPTIFLTNKFHLILEYDFQVRDYEEFSNGIVGVDPGLGTMHKATFAPTFVPSGKRDQMARPQIRLVYAFAIYNDVVRQHGLSQYYQGGNTGRIGQYLGLKSEWWF